mgnify:CR=1 FL=1
MADDLANDILRCIDELHVKLSSDGRVIFVHDGLAVDGGRHGLAIIDAFRDSSTFATALAQLEPCVRGRAEWIELTSAMRRLHECGILVNGRTVPRENYFDRSSSHVRMLDDVQRTLGYQQAIRAIVRPGDVVLDLGAGTGVLAITAALAGARHVYAVEAGKISEMAARLASTNGVSDRVTVLRGWSTRIELPELANVLITETFGSTPLSEDVRTSVADARRRLLRPEARLMPRRLRVFAAPLQVPSNCRSSHLFTVEAVDGWNQAYGIDFNVLREWPHGDFAQIRIPELQDWRCCVEPIDLGVIDLRDDENTIFRVLYACPPVTTTTQSLSITHSISQRIYGLRPALGILLRAQIGVFRCFYLPTQSQSGALTSSTTAASA